MNKRGYYYNQYEGQARRKLTFAERKINLVNMRDTIKKAGKELDTELQKYIQVLAGGRPSSKVIGEIAQLVTDTQKEMFEFGKTSASSEMDIPTPKTKDEVKGAMRKQNDKLIKKMVNDIGKRFKKKGYDFAEAGIVAQFFNGLKSLFVSGAINLGRQAIFGANKDMIYALQYSAILDDRTTELCRDLDGIIVKAGSSEERKYQPPNHWNCRSIWVEILQEEEFKPDFTKSIDDVELDKPEL